MIASKWIYPPFWLVKDCVLSGKVWPRTVRLPRRAHLVEDNKSTRKQRLQARNTLRNLIFFKHFACFQCSFSCFQVFWRQINGIILLTTIWNSKSALERICLQNFSRSTRSFRSSYWLTKQMSTLLSHNLAAECPHFTKNNFGSRHCLSGQRRALCGQCAAHQRTDAFAHRWNSAVFSVSPI